MRVLIASDNGLVSLHVREALLRAGVEPSAAQVVPLGQVAKGLDHLNPHLVAVVLSPDAQRGLAVLGSIRGQSQCHLIAVGPTADSRLVLQSLRNGANDYVDEADYAADMQLVLGRIRDPEPEPSTLGRMIAVLGPSGGAGSSTLAVNIATVLAREHQKSALIDLKLESGDLAALLDLKPTHTLAELCLNADRMDRVMFEHSLARHSSGIYLLAPPRTLADVESVVPEGVRRAVYMARQLFAYVVVDLDHTYREVQTQTLQQADLVLIVFRLDFTSLRNTRRVLDHFERLGIPPSRVRLIVNRYGQPKELPAAKAEEALGMKVCHWVPDDPKVINRANNNGVPVVVENPTAKVSRSVIELARSINGCHQSTAKEA
jgi:pilus assembly protein CpaE